jgi:ketosteroid isomerase-like protein
MAEENVETVRRMLEAFNEGGFSTDISVAFFDAEAVFEEPPEQPAPRIARGRDAVREVFNAFDEAWEAHRSEPEEIRALDDDRVLVLATEHFRVRDGIEIDQPSTTIFTLRDGKVRRMQAFWDRATALAAAGTPPEPG